MVTQLNVCWCEAVTSHNENEQTLTGFVETDEFAIKQHSKVSVSTAPSNLARG